MKKRVVWLWGLAERRELSQKGPGPRPKIVFSADHFCWQQVTANTLPFHPEKWGYCTLSPKSEVLVPLVPPPRKLRQWLSRCSASEDEKEDG